MKHEIRLYGEIGGWGITAEEIVANLPADATEITMRIHSPGGSVGEALAIYHALREHPAAVTTIVHGYAASSASFLMLAGDTRIVHRNSIVFVHNAWSVVQGDAEDLRKTADGLDVHDAAILDIYMQRTGIDEDALRDLMEGDTFFRGVDALALGFATELAKDEEAENSIAAMLDVERLLAAQAGGANMSTQKTRKEIVAELDAMKAQNEEQNTAHEAALADVMGQVEAKIAEVEAANEKTAEVSAELETVNAKIADLESALTANDELLAEKAGEVEAAKVEVESVTMELNKAREALKNPAIADAVMKDSKDVPAAQVDAEADAAEAAAKLAAEEAANAEPKNEVEVYEAMEAGPERREFWQKNKKKIIAQTEARAKEENSNDA